jgi:hypothetical protein
MSVKLTETLAAGWVRVANEPLRSKSQTQGRRCPHTTKQLTKRGTKSV